MSRSCSRRCFPVIRARAPVRAGRPARVGRPAAGGDGLLTPPSCRTGKAGSRSPCGQALLVRPADVRRPPELLEDPDRAGAGVYLAAEDAVPGPRGVRVVEVVPGLAEREQRQPPHVPGPVAALERALAARVADR